MASTLKTGPKEKTALFEAARSGNVSEVQRILEKGAAVNTRNENLATAIEVAAALGHSEMVRFLIKRGADVNAKDKDGHDALGFAIKGGFLEIVRHLIAAGASLKTGLFQYGPLSLAAMRNHTSILEELIGRGVSASGKDGGDAFEWAIHHKNEHAALMLHKAGLDLGAHPTCKLFTDAVQWGLPRVIKAMLKAGVDPEIRDVTGLTAREIAQINAKSKGKERQEILALLVKASKKGAPARAIFEAAASGNIKKLRQALSEGTNLEQKDGNQETPLLRAISHKQHAAIEVLLKAGADPNNGMPLSEGQRRLRTTKSKFETPLSLATLRGDTKTIDMLLRFGARLEGSGCESAACWCLVTGERGQLSAVERLLDAGLNPNCSWVGASMLRLAKSNKRTRVIEKLATLGAG